MRVLLTGLVVLGVSTVARHDAQAQLRVQRAEIMDRQGFERPLVAYTMFLPTGWRGEGGVEYPQDNCGLVSRLRWKASAPDGVGTIEIVPEEKWSAGNFPMPETRCLQSSVAAARPYLEWWVQRNRRGARVMDYRARADLLKGFEGLTRNDPQLGLRSWVDGGELLIAYEQNGKPVREAISTVVFFTHTRMPSVGNGQGIELLQGFSTPGFAMRMPEGALNFKMIEALRQSIRTSSRRARNSS